MTITVYDYKDTPTLIDIPAENIDEIASIHVHIITGDETGYIQLKNGTVIDFDASNNRLRDYDDGAYTMSTMEEIKAWMDFEFYRSIAAYSYQRQEPYLDGDYDYEDEESDDVIDI